MGSWPQAAPSPSVLRPPCRLRPLPAACPRIRQTRPWRHGAPGDEAVLEGIALSASSAECHPSDCYLRSGATDRCVEVGGRSRSAGGRFARSAPPCAERAQPPRRGEPWPTGNGRRGSQRGTPPWASCFRCSTARSAANVSAGRKLLAPRRQPLQDRRVVPSPHAQGDPDSSEPSERGSVSCMYSSRISLSTTANPSSRETTLSI